jgi:hypothetical protein
MVATNEPMYELLKRIQLDLSELKQSQVSMGLQLASMEQHAAASQVEIARISFDIAKLKGDMALVKRRLDLVEARISTRISVACNARWGSSIFLL